MTGETQHITHVTSDTKHLTPDLFYFWFYCIGATFCTSQEIRCLRYEGFSFMYYQKALALYMGGVPMILKAAYLFFFLNKGQYGTNYDLFRQLKTAKTV